MANEGMATIQLGNDIVKPIIEAKINEAILDAMKGSDHIIRQTVTGILNLKVDSNGDPKGYNSNQTFLAYLVQKCIKGAAEEAVKQYVNEQQPQFREHILKQLKSPSGSKKFADAMIAATAKSLESSYRLNVNIELGENH